MRFARWLGCTRRALFERYNAQGSIVDQLHLQLIQREPLFSGEVHTT